LLLFLLRKRSRRDFGSGSPKNKRLNSSNLDASAGLKGLQVLFYQAMPRAALKKFGNYWGRGYVKYVISEMKEAPNMEYII